MSKTVGKPDAFTMRASRDTRVRSARLRAAVVIVLAVFSIPGCSKSKDHEQRLDGARQQQPDESTTHIVNGHTLTDAEFRYGRAPTRNDEVVYQDDVVIVDGGANSIRSVGSDGITWTIDPRAAHADEVQPGKIVFITSRAAGRVLGMRQTAQGLAVTLGPFELTDLIKEVEISVDQSFAPAEMIAYSAPDFPGIIVKPISSSQPTVPPTLKPVSFFQTTSGPATAVSMLAAMGPPAQMNVDDFTITPFCCLGNLGMRVVYDKPEQLKVIALVELHLQKPSVGFKLAIHGGKIQMAYAELKGAAGLEMQFEARSALGVNGNINKQVTIPYDLSLPLFPSLLNKLPLPFDLTAHQAFIITTAFSAKDSTLRATADYAFTGTMYAGYWNGSWGVSTPSLTVKKSLLQSIDGVSLGPAALIMAYQTKFILGVGAFGFTVGPYLGYSAGIGTTRSGEAVGLLGAPCRTGDLSMDLSAGVGYMIPQFVTAVINFFLRALHMKQIERFAGLEHQEHVVTKHDAIPKGCA